MRRIFTFFVISMLALGGYAQKLEIVPEVSPQSFSTTDPLTITYDVTGTYMEDWDEAWLWLWFPDTEGISIPSNVNPASSDAASDAARFTRNDNDGTVTFSITVTLNVFTSISTDQVSSVGVLIKGNDWDDGQSIDHVFASGGTWNGEKADIVPSFSPDFFGPDDEVTISYDVTESTISHFEEAWLWTWTPGLSGFSIPSNVNPASDNTAATDPAKFTRRIEQGRIYFDLTTKISDLIQGETSGLQEVGMLIKGNDWADGQSTDYIVDLFEGFAMRVKQPATNYGIYEEGDEVFFEAVTSETATFTLFLDGTEIGRVENTTEFTYSHLAITDGATHAMELIASNGTEETTFEYNYLSVIVDEQPVPEGMVDGVNYLENPSQVTLVLTAPEKNNVIVLGDFNAWQVDDPYVMKKDGDRFWVTLTNLTPGVPYIYQYLIDGEVQIADPYAEKISSRWDDAEIIAEGRYPGLLPHPTDKTQEEAAYLQTNQTEYAWEITDFEKPAVEDLMIYELLVRDFTDERTYKAVTEKLDYLDSLGINALQLMPIMEFEGNISWGYNTAFKLAPDKYYGHEDDLKELIDEAHKRGIAVIFDIVLNHHFGRSSLVRMEADGSGVPTTENPWFNRTARHPFNVGYDFNHESQFTKDYSDRVLQYWVEEYHVDGYRFDLSKGFTQTFSGNDVGYWGQYDPSRISLINRMMNELREDHPETYIILEHFADNSEEKVLSENGMMLWGNMNHTYRSAAKGSTVNLDWLYHGTRGWEDPHVVGYMESHDEERVAWDLFESSSSGDFGYKINRLQLNAIFFFLVPGPKMIWQFGEMGYDEWLNGENGEKRLEIKPTHWEYLEDPDRRRLFDVYQALMNLKTKTAYLEDENFTWKPSGSVKWINYDNADVKISAFGNFGNQMEDADPNFVSTGTWYDYFTGEQIEVTDVHETIPLRPGEFYVYTSEPIDNYIVENPIKVITGNREELKQTILAFPNPTTDKVQIPTIYRDLQIRDLSGRILLRTNEYLKELDLSHFIDGIYLIEIRDTRDRVHQIKVVKTRF